MPLQVRGYRSFLLDWKERWPFFFTIAQLETLASEKSEEHARVMMLAVLSQISAQLNPDKPAGAKFKQKLPPLTTLLQQATVDADTLKRELSQLFVPLIFYSKHCLTACASDQAAAQEKFITDLCIAPPKKRVTLKAAHVNDPPDAAFYDLASYVWRLAKKIPAYQVSTFLIEGLRKQVQDSKLNQYSVLNDPKAEQYGYSQAAKAILAASIVYAEMSTYSYIPCSLLLITEQEIDCTGLTRYPSVNQCTQQVLKIILPYAAVFGAYYAQSEDAPLSSVATYAAMSFVFLRVGLKACDLLQQGGHFLYRKAMGIPQAKKPKPQLSSFLWKQTLHISGMALFHYLIPPTPWLRTSSAIDDPSAASVKSECADNIDARDKAAQVLGLNPKATRKEISARVRKLGWELYAGNKGYPKDPERAMAINNAKECLIEYAEYEKNKYQF